MSELQALEKWAGGLLAQLSPAARRSAMRDVARELRRSQQARIAAQRNPDESAFAPRKARAAKGKKLREKKGRIKRAAMFAKLRTARFLDIESDAMGLAVGFAGRVSRVARVHQYGLKDRVAPHGVEYKYPARALLGFTDTDRDLIRDMLLRHVMKHNT
ncbi:phage virion morphogenesis protein [Paraburkholderia phenazinium]|uniref:phage virion morphogenesis protein n=1 Tax=Paraburkholderia phenazinium TaxID=60549 RepID=UPI0015885304|nr:phage virion morphogenesis protein [Paraburkholderia phenazinium]